MPGPAPNDHHDPARFVTTRWTQVLTTRGESDRAREALSELCASYYSPVVAFLRREGRAEDEARELAHEFFARVLEGSTLAGADPARGRFRSYLLGALKHFLAARRAREQRQKRGGGAEHQPLVDEFDTAAGDLPGVHATATPEAIFDRAWALRVLDCAMGHLRAEWEARGAGEEFHQLKPWLTADRAARPNESSPSPALPDGAARVRLHRFRRRFGELVRAEIAGTVADPDEVREELRHLIAALS